MSIIQVSHLTFAYEGSYDNIFEDVSFHLDTNWRTGFTGRNGRGKTTFLKLLMGELPYQGTISSNVPFAYFPCTIEDSRRSAAQVLAAAAPDSEEWRLERELGLLNVSLAVLEQPFFTLSNGEQTKLLLAALFQNDEQFLLIDEPTNHLDTEGRVSVAKYLLGKQGFILVSHDRAFLDGCTDHILSINRANIEVRKGNFSSWWENNQRQEQFERTQNERLTKDVARLESAARRASDWSDQTEKGKYAANNSGLRPDRGYVGHKSAKMMQRAKSIENRRTAAAEEKAGLLKNVEKAETLKLHPLPYRGGALVRLKDVAIGYDSRTVVDGVSFSIESGERVALLGKNGSGKSSLLKLICGENISYTGTLELGKGLVISHVPQDTTGLRGGLKDFARAQRADETLLFTILRKLGFSRTQFEKDLSDFSAGQRKKALLAASLCSSAHLYIWDEPFNYIDVISRIQLEELIEAYAPTMLFVEHDATFVENMATRTVQL